jgi:hypothetical protein
MSQQRSLRVREGELVGLREASEWASQYLGRQVTISNLSYLVQYGRLKRHGDNGSLLISTLELKQYYDSYDKEKRWKDLLGDDLNWRLSFVEYKESERTKHVHRLHPYKGKFIPQLVEYFLDTHTDEFKKRIYFSKGDIVLDPFCGSGTTLVEANELGLYCIGVDISAFNAIISNVKVSKHSLPDIAKASAIMTKHLHEFQKSRSNMLFEEHLLAELATFNQKHFPSPEYKRRVLTGAVDERVYASEKEREFLATYKALVRQHRIRITQDASDTFLGKWFLQPVREEIDFLFEQLKTMRDSDVKRVLGVILSRTIRSCRATTHADLATLKNPVTTTYYCKKHGKICKPLFSIMSWWQRYAQDSIERLSVFDKLRTNTRQVCLVGDSRKIDLFAETERKNPEISRLLIKQKIRGIFSSPPYVGLIDYHEQHAYAYEIFGFDRRDALEIGPLCKGQGKEARDSYVEGIAAALRNCRKFLAADYDVLLVANDKFDLYPRIADLAGMNIADRFKRPVLNRVEKDRSAYAEVIFHLKEK